MALTNEEKQELLNAIKAESQGVDELTEVTTLDNVKSLPAMRGDELVSAPISLLAKPATDAAAAANAAATAATGAKERADAAAKLASEKATEAETEANNAKAAGERADIAAGKALSAAGDYQNIALPALHGGTARFDGIVETATVQLLSTTIAGGSIVYVRSAKLFAYYVDGKYYNNWGVDGIPSARLYQNEDYSGIPHNKVYLLQETLYAWNAEEDDLVEVSGSGSGAGFYNVTKEHPLDTGYYTKETAIAALSAADIKDEEKKGTIITFETSPGKWVDYRFIGTVNSDFTDSNAWEEYGGAGAVKKITVRKGTSSEVLTPDEQGGVELKIPEVTIDPTIDENSTNTVENKAIAAKFKEMGGKYGASLQLNTIGEGAEKAYSLSLLDENGEVLNTSDMFTGGGGGSVATTKITLTRITANPTVKSGDEVKLTYKYDHVDTASGESTGNSGRATVTITHGANSTALEQTVAAGSTNTVDATKYMGVGTNTVKVRVQTGEGEEMQVAQITWTVNVVQLTLTSSFNIATPITRGDTVSVPYALSGSGQKTLRCYVDGTDTDDRSVTTSTANGSFSVNTAGMAHGSHSVQLVVELELAGGNVIKSNSIYFAVGVREPAENTPVVSARFDYADGTIIPNGTKPYIPTRQYDTYELNYAVYNPRETPTEVSVYADSTLLSKAKVPFAAQQLTLRAMTDGRQECRIECGATTYPYGLHVEKSDLNVSKPTDNLTLELTAEGRSNQDTNREEWSYNGIQTTFEGFKWGGDGWMDGALRVNDQSRATVHFKPLEQPEQNITGAFAFMVKYKVSEVVDEEAELIRCVDTDGTGFVITSQEARMQTRGKGKLAMKMAAGEVYEVAFVSFPKATAGSSDYETTNTEMVYLYINGIMSGCVQRAAGDSIYQGTPQDITIGSDGATIDVYLLRAYDNYLSDAQVLDCYMVDQADVETLVNLYNANNVIDDNGNVTVDSVPEGMRYMIVTGRQENGVPTLLQAAVNNDKDPKYDVDEILCIVKGVPALNFRLVGGCIRLQGTSSLAYPIKNYRTYFKNSQKVPGQLYLGCNEQGVGGELQAKAKYSFRLPDKDGKRPAAVDCHCLKADYAESSSSHNTGMAKLANDTLVAAGELTPAQRYADSSFGTHIRTTIDGEPCYLFYRGTQEDTPQFLGKFNYNNDKSTEAVFGFLDIPGYHDGQWVTDKFGGDNPTECWEFLNNDYAMGMFKEDDFTKKEEDGTPSWLKVFEARFPDDDDRNAEYEAGTRLPEYLQRTVQWVKSTETDGSKFRSELKNYFDVDYLCDYYMFTDIFGCVDQRVKNMMLGFWYTPEADTADDPMKGMRGYFIFYDCDTILGVRNDGRLKYGWDIDEETTDPELTTADKTVYAYAGHDSVLWKNLREQFPNELAAAYRRLREKMSNSAVFNMFDKEQSAKFCQRIYNLDAINKYVIPKTRGVEVNKDGSITTMKYSYLESMQGSRKSHRHWWVTNRMDLFDARYGTGQYPSTDIAFKGNSEAGATVKATPARDYYFEFRREGDTMTHTAVAKDTEWSYTYDQMANIGTIFHLFGGRWMKKLDLSGWGGFTDLTLPELPILEELTLGTYAKTYALTELVLGTKLPMMRKLTMRNYINLPSVDVSGCNRLEELDAAGCDKLSTISFAEGATLSRLHLPQNFQTLVLRSMQYLTWGGITFDNKRNLTGLWIENCANINGKAVFDELFALNGALKHVRITGLELEGDGSDLERWYAAGLGGIDADGNTTTKCKLCGTYKLTTYLDEATYAKYAARFDELNIRQPEYTMLEFDDSVADDANVSNLDNKTGYKYGNAYVPSGHVAAILSRRHRVLAKVTKLPTQRNVKIANVDTAMNNLDGVATYYPLDDENSNRYVDGTEAKLDGTQGNWMMYEPHMFFKGINDYLKGKHYACYSSADEKPETPEATVLTLDDIKGGNGSYRQGYKVMSGRDTLSNAYSADSKYSVCGVNVDGYRRVRFPSVPGTNLVGSVFTDAGGNVVKTVVVSTLNCKFEEGMYLISDVPEGAASLYFSILNTAEFDKVVLSKSDRIEDMEPEWVEEDAYLCGVVGSSIVGERLRACITGGSTAASMTWTDFHYYSVLCGMQQIDPMMHNRIANLFYAKYGRRDSQAQCGAGSHTNSRITGGTAERGMTDTIGFEAAKAVDPKLTPALVDGLNPQYSWCEVPDADGNPTIKQLSNSCCLGYEDIYGHKYDMMDRVDLPNDSGNAGKWRIWMPDGSIRLVKGKTASDQYIVAVAHGLHMDIIPVGTASGSYNTHYCDKYWISTSLGRVVYRGCYFAYAFGGVSYAVANNDASSANPYIGSRLAFRGTLVKAQSVAAYKAAQEQ